MSIKVDNSLKESDSNDLFLQKTHYMPCAINENGPANVNGYFEPYVKENSNGELTASFRGRPLDGVKMVLPDGYRAVVVNESKRPLNGDADRHFQIVGGFKEMVYWNWDKKPSKNDSFIKAMDWIDIANALHRN